MKYQLRFRTLILAFSFLLMSSFSIAQGRNGFNLQRKSNNYNVFIPENSKIKVKLNTGNDVTGNLSGADSNAIYITRNNGKQKAIPIGSINKMTVFHPHRYFTLLGGLTEAGINGCGSNNCGVVEGAIILTVFFAITAGELIVDGIADIANDDHYDLTSTWRIAGPVVGR